MKKKTEPFSPEHDWEKIIDNANWSARSNPPFDNKSMFPIIFDGRHYIFAGEHPKQHSQLFDQTLKRTLSLSAMINYLVRQQKYDRDMALNICHFAFRRWQQGKNPRQLDEKDEAEFENYLRKNK
jgi:hypothetical protein